jgi:hypothetical protein
MRPRAAVLRERTIRQLVLDDSLDNPVPLPPERSFLPRRKG